MAEGTYVVIRRSVGLLRSSYALVERFDDRASALLAANRLNAGAARAGEGACFVVLVAPPHIPELDRVWSQDSSLPDGSRAISSYLGTRWFPVR